MVKLFHLSEDPTIQKFIPRKSKEVWGYKKYVWAISEPQLHNYLFPRDCPRICVGGDEIGHINGYSSDFNTNIYKAAVFISDDWEERFKTCVLYQYTFSPDNFEVIDHTAGYLVSEYVEEPIEVKIIEHCPAVLRSMNVGIVVKSADELRSIRNKLLSTTNNFSIIKWNNLIT